MAEDLDKYLLRKEIANGLYVGSIDTPITASADQMNALAALSDLLTELLYRNKYE